MKGLYSMRLSKMSFAAGAVVLVLTGTAFAQTPAQPPKPQTPPAQPPATQPPAATTPAPKPPSPPMPFPQDSKIAFVDIQSIASSSAAGKDATKKLQDLTSKKSAEIADKNKQLQAAQSKLQQGGAVLNDAARQQLEKDVDRLQREIQFANSNAQAEVNELQNELQGDFQKKLIPIIEEVAKEKGLYVVFTTDSGVAYMHAGLDISSEIIKRLDAKKD
jgi:outer membrane protein